MSDVTQLLMAIGQGDLKARDELLPIVYEELRLLARSRMKRERVEHTLDATALVHEAYLRLLGESHSRFDCRAHFFSAAAEAMRRILIEHARRRQAMKHGGGLQRLPFAEELPAISVPLGSIDDLLSLDEAMTQFALESPEAAELVKLLYFGGLNLEEAAEVLGTSRTTAYRRWQFARAWLFEAITGEPKAR